MIKNLVKIAEQLDAAGFTKEADQIDQIIRKIAMKPHWSQHQCTTGGDTFERFVIGHKQSHGGADMETTIAYNKKKDHSFDPKKVKRYQAFWLLCDDTCGP